MGASATSVVSRIVTGGASPNLFKSPKPPQAQPLPTADTAAVQQEAADTAKRRSRARGYRSTILSQQFLAPAQPAGELKHTMGA